MSNKNSDTNSKTSAGAESSNSSSSSNSISSNSSNRNPDQICRAFINAQNFMPVLAPVTPVVVPAREVEVSIDTNYAAKGARATRRPTHVPRP